MDKDEQKGEQRRRFWRVGVCVLVAVVVVYFAVAYWQKWPPFKVGEDEAGEAAAATGGGGVAVAVVGALGAVAAVVFMWRRQGRGEVEPKTDEVAMILHGVGVRVPPQVVLDGKVPSSDAVKRHFQRAEGSTGLKSFFSGLFRYIPPMRPVQDMFWNRSGPVVEELLREGGKPLSKKRVRELADNRREAVTVKRQRLVGEQSSWGKTYYKTHLKNTNAFVAALDTLSVASKKERKVLYDEVLARARSWEASYKVYASKERGEVPAFRGPESGDASEAIQSAWVLSMLNERNALKALRARPAKIEEVRARVG